MSLLRGSGPQQPDPQPLEIDNTRVVLIGTVLWAGALVVLLLAALFGADVHGWWLAMCACGAVLGVAGLRFVALRKQALTRDRRR